MKVFKTLSYFSSMAIAAIFCIACASKQDGSLVPAQVFSDGMILAKGKPVHVFGEGDGRVSVRIAGKRAAAKSVDGKWDISLPAMKAGGPYTMTIRSKYGKSVLNDVYIGNVIMVSGQSNMQFKLSESSTPKEEWTSDPLLRSYSLPNIEKREPYSPEDGWIACADTNAGKWSAIGYHVGKLLREKTGEATAIINCYQSASIIEAWIPKEISSKEEYILPDELLHFDHHYKPYFWNAPGCLYDFSLKHIFPYALNQVVWYQGESNSGEGEYKTYPALATELVKSWREAFQDPELPFIMVQIADYVYRQDDAWRNLQASQMTIPSLIDGVTVVPCADICESNHIHPMTKSRLAARIADTICQHGTL